MKHFLIFIFHALLLNNLFAQTDTVHPSEAVYDRPFISIGKTRTAVGGYIEGNTNYFAEDGVSEGFSMELRRFNIFLYSSISPRIKLLSEIEFEHGTEEIAIETAMLDFEIDPLLIFRTGILLAPIGNFNINHDSPKWEFIDRPLVATQIIPSTLSEIGLGFHGNYFIKNTSLSYYAYLVNGLQDDIILNSDGKTLLQNGKSEEMFGEDNNGIPMFTGKFSLSNRKYGEIGGSYYGGIYNTYSLEGTVVDVKRKLSILAFDFNTKIMNKIEIRGEAAQNIINVPDNITEIYGEKQWGYYTEVIFPVLKKDILRFENTIVNVNVRTEKIDYNMGTFASTGKKIFDEINALAIGASIRPTSNTVIKANYRYHWSTDVVGNLVKSAGFQFGVASYF